MADKVKVISIEYLTHDVLHLKTGKPEGYTYQPGQAADLSIDKPGWDDKLSAFTFVSLPEDDFLEFVVKTYPQRNRVTNELLGLKEGDNLLVHKPFGSIRYRGEGIFIAGGAGITPFLAILKNLERNGKVAGNKLIFANKTWDDIILKEYFENLLGKNFINILSEETKPGYEHGFVTADFIKKHTNEGLKYYYLCGPKPMMKAVGEALASLGIDKNHIVVEEF
jgi:ferredoxin-NADP reductase